MNPEEPIIADSARKHGLKDEDIVHAYHHPIRLFEFDEGFTMLIGGNVTGALCEIGVVEGNEGPVIVHAMLARSKFLR